MKTVPLADVLWDAANERPNTEPRESRELQKWSCWAINAAIGEDEISGHDEPTGAHWEFLLSLGLKIDTDNILNCGQYDPQGARYMWLLLAMHVAEDENVVVEIA